MSLVHALRHEIEQINGDEMRGFVVDVLADYDEKADENKDRNVYAYHTKRIVSLMRIMLEELDITDRLMDIGTAAALIHLAGSLTDDPTGVENRLGALALRGRYAGLQSNIGLEDYDAVMRLVEGQHGIHSPIPQVEPQLDDPVYVWLLPLAIRIAKEGVI